MKRKHYADSPDGTYLFFPRPNDRCWVVARRGNLYQLVAHADNELIAELIADIDREFNNQTQSKGTPRKGTP